MLMEATGASSVEEASRLALGRPPVAELDEAVRRVAQERGVPVALVIREAVAQYVGTGSR